MGAEGSQSIMYRQVIRILELAEELAPGRVSGLMECTDMRDADVEAFSKAAGAVGIPWGGPICYALGTGPL